MDTLISEFAPASVVKLYRDVRLTAQRVDIGRFMILHLYGGLYADLDILPNRDTYPQVWLGLCKIASRSPSQPPEWEIEMVVATRGNPVLLEILEHMCSATRQKKTINFYKKKPCRFIYNTTGPKSVAKYLKMQAASGSGSVRVYRRKPCIERVCVYLRKRTIKFFSMCRPIEQLEKHVAIDESGRISGDYLQTLAHFDVLSAFSMSYRGQAAGVPEPVHIPLAELTPFPNQSRLETIADEELDETMPDDGIECSETKSNHSFSVRYAELFTCKGHLSTPRS